MCDFVSVSTILPCMSLCHYHGNFVTVDLWYNLRLADMGPSVLFLELLLLFKFFGAFIFHFFLVL